jgi:signal peptidase
VRRRLRRIGRWLGGIALVLVIAVIALGWPASLGGRTSYSIVSGHSMNPTYHTGDLVVVQRARTYHVGDIVVYRVPAGEPASGQCVVHRIVGGSNVTGYVTKGDNNPSVDIWVPRNADIQGRAVALIPQAGWVLRQGRDPLLYAALGGLYCARLLWPTKKSAKAAEREKVDLRKAPRPVAEAAATESPGSPESRKSPELPEPVAPAPGR